MKKILCLLSASLLLFTSCSSDATSNNSDAILLKRATNGSTTLDYHYNGSKLVSINEEGGPTHWDFTYTGDLITRTRLYVYNNVDVTNELIFEYDSNQRLVSQKQLHYPTFTADKYLYAYNSDGTVSYELYSGDFGNQNNLSRTGIIYLNASGEAIKVDDYYQGVFDNSREYTYDVKNSMFKNVTGYNKLFAIFDIGKINNLLTGSQHDSNNNLIFDYSFQYVYNDDNYPVSCTGSGAGNTTQYFYE